MNASITILHVNDTSHIGGLQGSTICDQAVNRAIQICLDGDDCILWDDDGDVLFYEAPTAKVRRLDEESIKEFGFDAADYRRHVAECVDLKRIAALRGEAAEAGDVAMVALCDRAAYDDEARYRCARALLWADGQE